MTEEKVSYKEVKKGNRKECAVKTGAWWIAQRNIKYKPGRAYGLMTLTGILCFVLFVSSFLIFSLKNGIRSLSGRMGADLIVVPEGYDSKITGAILRGEPNSFFFDKSVADRVRQLDGVAEASPQLFLATLSAGCCSYPLQIIGVDFDSDFSVVPWLSGQVELPLPEGGIIVGASVEGTYNEEVRFFGRPFRIKGRLAKTGMGFDTSVFMGMEETRALAAEFEKLLGNPAAEDENLISSVMVRVSQGTDPRAVQAAISQEFRGEGVYPLVSKQMMTEVSGNLNSLLTYIYILIALLWLLAFLVLLLVHSVSIRERRREFATLRVLGATRKKLKEICLSELLLINGGGALSGAVLGAAVALLFGPAFSKALKMPFLEPHAGMLALLFLMTVLAGTLLGPLSALHALREMDRRELALLTREND